MTYFGNILVFSILQIMTNFGHCRLLCFVVNGTLLCCEPCEPSVKVVVATITHGFVT